MRLGCKLLWSRLRTRALVTVAIMILGLPAAHASMLVSSFSNDTILRYNAGTGAFEGVFVPPGSGGLDGPWGLTLGPGGGLYVSSSYSGEVLRFDGVTGSFLGSFVSAHSGGLQFPVGLTFGPDGNLYVTDGALYRDQVFRYDGNTGAFIGLFVDSYALGGAYGLTFGADGNLYVGSRDGNAVRLYDGTTGAPLGDFASVYQPRGVTFGPDGHLYVTSGVDVIQRCDAAGVCVDFVSPPAGNLNGLSLGLAFGPDGNLYVTSDGNHKVARFDGATGAYIDDFVPSGSGGLLGPESIVFQPVPEPGTLAFLAVGMGVIAVLSSRRPSGRRQRS
jgi:sugar lactone lactonase YvrE